MIKVIKGHVKKLDRAKPLRTDKKVIELMEWMCDNDNIIEAIETMVACLAPVQRDRAMEELNRMRLNNAADFVFDHGSYMKQWAPNMTDAEKEKEFLRKCSYGSIMDITETLTICLAPGQRDRVIEELKALKNRFGMSFGAKI